MSAHALLYQKHLDQVSRSFAFCIRELKEPLYSCVALAYLLCRILDTVEDSPYPQTQQKFKQLEEFNQFIKEPSSLAKIQSWISELPTTMKPSEKALMLDAAIMFEDLHGLPKDRKKVMQDLVLSMSNGMVYYLRRSNNANELKLKNQADVNRYCFFVAGVVGELLTRLLATTNINFQLNSESLLRAHHFGLFLQKINLLKDQMSDEAVGRFLVPSQPEMWKSLNQNAQGAIDYLLAIPKEEREYRLFCGWSLFLGLASIPFIKKTWARKLLDKIPRVATEQILASVTERIDDNEKLKELFEKMKLSAEDLASLKSVAVSTSENSASDDSFDDFKNLYIGTLPSSHLQSLGMVNATHPATL
jgi:phytoene/squalene synthetase